MRIAQVAPLFESVPPRRYGGTERVVYSLTEELVRRGHEVTLYATGDSQTSARLRPALRQPLRQISGIQDPCAYHGLQLGMVYREAEDFDVIHSHAEFRALPFSLLVQTPTVSTNHNRLDTRDCLAICRAYPEAYLTSISNSQRAPLPWANWVATVYNALSTDLYTYSASEGSYLVFLGRMSPEKGPAEAIEVAKRVGIPLKIAARVTPHDRDYFDEVLRPALDHKLIEFLGEIDERAKVKLLAGAYALLFPVNWPEPFGLVMIEAMACGTPVLAHPIGAVPEVVTDGVTGFHCRDIDEMVARVADVGRLNRQDCRMEVERRFSIKQMTDDYERAYCKVIEAETRRRKLAA